jgi:hypothetical protein
VEGLKRDLLNLQKSRKFASSALRKALQKAAQLRLMEKEKNKTPSCAMRISMKISKVVWSMLADGNTFAEAEISDMVYVQTLLKQLFVCSSFFYCVLMYCVPTSLHLLTNFFFFWI